MEGNPNTWFVDEILQSSSSTQTPLSHSSQLELEKKEKLLSPFSLHPRCKVFIHSQYSLWASQMHRAKKNPPANAGGMGSNPGLARFPWSKKWQPTPAFLPGESHGQRSLPDYSPWGCKESNTTECTCAHTRTHTHTHIDTIIYEISAKFGIRKLELFNEILTRLMKIYRETVIKHCIHVGYNQ